MKKLFIATLLAIMSLSVWGQSKLSPYTRHYVERIKQEKVADSRQSGKTPLQKKLNTRGQLVIPAFIHLNEGYTPDILTPCGVEVRSVIGQILTADIPFEALSRWERPSSRDSTRPARMPSSTTYKPAYRFPRNTGAVG